MSAELLTGLLVGAGGLITAFVLWRKAPAERNDIKITSADKVNAMTLRFAGDVNKDNEALREDIDEMRREFDQYRTDTQTRLDEMSVELRAERAEKLAVKRENETLRERVDELEREVASLKASGGPHNPTGH